MKTENMISTAIDFDLKTGLSKTRKPLQRRLSAMKGLFYDDHAYQDKLSKEDVLVYEFFDMGVPESEAEIAYGTSITSPLAGSIA